MEEPVRHRHGAATSQSHWGLASHIPLELESSTLLFFFFFPPPKEFKTTETTTKYFEFGSYSPSEATGWINVTLSWDFTAFQWQNT